MTSDQPQGEERRVQERLREAEAAALDFRRRNGLRLDDYLGGPVDWDTGDPV